MWFVRKRKHNTAGEIIDNGGVWEIMDEPTGVEYGDMCRVENAYGGWHYYTITKEDEIFESDWDTVEREQYQSYTDAEYGWIAPDGTFYGCNYENHAHCIYAVSGMYESNAERAGWIKIYRDPTMARYHPERTNEFDGCYWITDSEMMTPAQKKTLHERGFKIETY